MGRPARVGAVRRNRYRHLAPQARPGAATGRTAPGWEQGTGNRREGTRGHERGAGQWRCHVPAHVRPIAWLDTHRTVADANERSPRQNAPCQETWAGHRSRLDTHRTVADTRKRPGDAHPQDDSDFNTNPNLPRHPHGARIVHHPQQRTRRQDHRALFVNSFCYRVHLIHLHAAGAG